MESMIAAFSLAAFLACVAMLAIILRYDVELTLHLPIFAKLKLTSNRSPELGQSPGLSTTIPVQLQSAELPAEEQMIGQDQCVGDTRPACCRAGRSGAGLTAQTPKASAF